MTTAPSLNSSSESWTMRPEILPFSSKTLNALNIALHFQLHVQPCLPRFFDRAFVFDRRDVARIAIEDHRLQDAAHQLSASRLGQHPNEVQLSDHRHRTQLTTDRVDHGLAQVS